MTLFKLTDTIAEFKCASGSKKTFLDPNGGKIQIDARWGSQEDDPVMIDSPKYLWSSGFKMPITLTLIPPVGKFIADATVKFKAGAEDFPFTAKWLDVAPPVVIKPVGDAFGESSMSKPLSALEQLTIDVQKVIAQNELILGALGDLINK